MDGQGTQDAARDGDGAQEEGGQIVNSPLAAVGDGGGDAGEEDDGQGYGGEFVGGLVGEEERDAGTSTKPPPAPMIVP